MNLGVLYKQYTSLSGVKAAVFVVCLGALSALALPPFYGLPLLFLTFPLFVVRLNRCTCGKQAFAQGYWFGFGFHSAGLYWLINAILIRAHDFWWLVPIVSPLCAILLAFWTGLVGLGFYLSNPRKKNNIVLFAGLWTLCDMSRGLVVPAQWWNPLLTGFPWNPLGSCWEYPGQLGNLLIQPASLMGVDGLTFFIVLLALTPLLKYKGLIVFCITLGFWCSFSFIRLAPAPLADSKTPIVAVVQGNIAEDDKINNTDPRRIFQKYLELTIKGVDLAKKEQLLQRIPNRPIVFVWPESAFPGDIEYDAIAREILMQNNPEASYGILGAVTQKDRDKIYNSLVVLNSKGASIAKEYHKSKLVPFGEMQPWYVPFHVVPGISLTPGYGNETFSLPNLASFAPLICYEIIFSGQIIKSGHRSKWVLNVTNDAWYGNSAGPYQHLAASRLRAVEEGLPVVRVANTGISAVFDPYGRELSRIKWGEENTIAVPLPGALPPTLFSVGGRYIPVILSILSILVGFMWSRKPAK